MIIVYFEYMKTHYCEEVARFTSYEAYDKCYDTLTKLVLLRRTYELTRNRKQL